MGSLGMPELLVIGGILVLLFGSSKIGELFGSLGKGIATFKKEVRAGDAGDKEDK